ncbi:MFS transporter [Methylacidiphilum kamchatkense]|uniref:MFS transporter n=1 Tax=Methylacidiphilum kamchatkense Kam1 TaxID=1202785 RepID=A0A516TKG7_9BACT|nr:MFS transporter [Methylacidiphilum kamchatkense]QDQ41727.1 MFS transporter [Methylacidiphilum kamchatkense Kam1]
MDPEHSNKGGFFSKLKNSASYSASLQLVILFGCVSLAADVTYEGARSILGPFLGVVGATGSAIGFIAGIGELTGYVVRLVAGSLGDKTKSHWVFVFAGYFINQIAVPLLAIAKNWPQVGLLIVLERFGKGIRTPSRDVLLSHATEGVGRGFGFGIHEALDQVGAMTGPFLIALAIMHWKSYRTALGLLIIPAFLALLILFVTHKRYQKLSAFLDDCQPKEQNDKAGSKRQGLTESFWWYITALEFLAAGYVDFPLIAYHFGQKSIFKEYEIPLLYMLAMGVDAIVALVAGRLFDKSGIGSMSWPIILGSLSSPLIFLFPIRTVAIIGTIFWGIGLGVQESAVRAAIASLVPIDIRGTAFGIFYLVFGLSWFLGSCAMGFLYDKSLAYVALSSFILQILSLPLLERSQKKIKEQKKSV